MNAQRREVYEQQILRCLLAKMYIKDIGQVCGLNQATVRKYIQAPEFRATLRDKYPEIYAAVDAQLAGAADTIGAILEENSKKALMRISELIDSENEHIALKASQDSLDRFKETAAVHKVEADHSVKIDPTLLVLAAATAKEVDEFRQRSLPQGGVKVLQVKTDDKVQ